MTCHSLAGRQTRKPVSIESLVERHVVEATGELRERIAQDPEGARALIAGMHGFIPRSAVEPEAPSCVTD